MDGLTFPNPFGIAAGLGKNVTFYHSLITLVRPGFIEVVLIVTGGIDTIDRA
jgi:dihydroorotate dehydrogenase